MEELLVFEVTQQECIDKIKELASDCADFDMAIARLNTEISNSDDINNNFVYGIAIENFNKQLHKHRSQIRKWRMYLDILNHKVNNSNVITTADIENARQYDLVSLIGQDIELKKSGSNYVACCPFHNEDTPSFIIKNNTYYCFGCKEHGDCIDWLTKKRGMKFGEAVKYLSNHG